MKVADHSEKGFHVRIGNPARYCNSGICGGACGRIPRRNKGLTPKNRISKRNDRKTAKMKRESRRRNRRA
jgi:hypothetical protein